VWVIASIPFWLGGVGCILVAGCGCYGWLRRPKHPDDFNVAMGSLTFLIISGVLFLIAAKIVS